MPLATRICFFLGEPATLRTRAGSDSCFTTLSPWQSPSTWMDGASGSRSHGTLLQAGKRSRGNVQEGNQRRPFSYFFKKNKDLLCEVSRFVFLFPNKWNWAQFYVNVPKVEAFNQEPPGKQRLSSCSPQVPRPWPSLHLLPFLLPFCSSSLLWEGVSALSLMADCLQTSE